MDHVQGLSTQITYTCVYKLCPIEPLIMHRLRGRGGYRENLHDHKIVYNIYMIII